MDIWDNTDYNKNIRAVRPYRECCRLKGLCEESEEQNQMEFLQNEKCIETDQLNITGNIMTWQGTMIQLSNVSYITTKRVNVTPFPWGGLVLIGVGACAWIFTKSWLALLIILLGGVIIGEWYIENKKRAQLKILTICMNSGKNLQFLFTDWMFLNRVLSVLEKIIVSGGIGSQNISIDLSGSQFSGDAHVLNNLGIGQK